MPGRTHSGLCRQLSRDDEPVSRQQPYSKAPANGCMFKGAGVTQDSLSVGGKGREEGQRGLFKGRDTGIALID